MKRMLFASALVALAAPTLAADVGVSVSIGQPGFYGQIDIGNYPRPQVIYAEPVIIQRVPVGVVRQPVYLHVPPGHAKNWSKHCYRYDACGRPVYFVQDRWYDEVYVPRYRSSQVVYRDDDRRGDWDDDRGGRRGDDHGRGRGHGRGKHRD
ncbi:MAG: hypothetical protein IT517_07925 [Burkholderiales bacterium]|jgi:hypothetical protein|nr:hypothetical protein [Burkholderiales bacterium]